MRNKNQGKTRNVQSPGFLFTQVTIQSPHLCENVATIVNLSKLAKCVSRSLLEKMCYL